MGSDLVNGGRWRGLLRRGRRLYSSSALWATLAFGRAVLFVLLLFAAAGATQ
jgi:hypothetical protein